MTPEDCPKWNKCSAPICPFDPDWMRRSHVPRESICLWLREWSKHPSEDLQMALPAGVMASGVAEVAPQVMARWSDIRARLKVASRQGSKRRNGLALNRLKDAQQPPGAVELANGRGLVNTCRDPGMVFPVPTRETDA